MPHPLKMPQGMAYGWWHFTEERLHDLTFAVEISGDLGRTPDRYLQLYQGEIGGQGMYFGFQTDVFRPGRGGQGHGLLFSRWGTRDEHDALASPDGWIESSGHEGDFVGVRAPWAWEAGKYDCHVAPSRMEKAATWFEFRAKRLADGKEVSAGQLRFGYVDGAPPLIHSGGSTWTEVYSGAKDIADVPLTQIAMSVRANGGTLSPIRCDTDYAAKFPASDAYCDAKGLLTLRSGTDGSGTGVERQNAPQRVKIRQ